MTGKIKTKVSEINIAGHKDIICCDSQVHPRCFRGKVKSQNNINCPWYIGGREQLFEEFLEFKEFYRIWGTERISTWPNHRLIELKPQPRKPIHGFYCHILKPQCMRGKKCLHLFFIKTLLFLLYQCTDKTLLSISLASWAVITAVV